MIYIEFIDDPKKKNQNSITSPPKLPWCTNTHWLFSNDNKSTPPFSQENYFDFYWSSSDENIQNPITPAMLV